MFHGMSCWTTRRNPPESTEAGKPQAGADDEGSTHTGMVQNPFSSNSVTCINYQLIQDWTAINEYLLLGTQHSAHHVVRFTAYLESKWFFNPQRWRIARCSDRKVFVIAVCVFIHVILPFDEEFHNQSNKTTFLQSTQTRSARGRNSDHMRFCKFGMTRNQSCHTISYHFCLKSRR